MPKTAIYMLMQECMNSEENKMFTEFMRGASAYSPAGTPQSLSVRAETRTWRRKRRTARLARVPLAA
eukprot:GDKH01008741.1.p1 GENE.GDKH01008741.1~~GDKH01008741.1.p1  ORF type:complete len:67 (-),score=2.31 GDKH01008741.1:21-221(-)